MRKFICMSLALVLAVALAACGGSQRQPENEGAKSAAGSSKKYAEFRMGEMLWSGPVFYRLNAWDQVGQIESLVVQKLLESGQNDQVTLGLASSVERPNPTTYVYNIRQGVKFSDGKPLTVADVLYSLELNKDKLFQDKESWENVASIAARGASAVVVRLKHPNLDWPEVMVMASGIVEKSSVDKLKESELGTQHGLPIGTGPWKYDSFTPESSVQLSRNPYWSGSPQPAERISFTVFKNEAEMALALRSGAIDAAAAYESQKLFVSIPDTHQLAGSQNWMTWMSMNMTTPPLNNVHVRRALAYATDTAGIIKALYPRGGASANPSIIPAPLFVNYGSSDQINQMIASLPKYEFNIAKARQELAKSPVPHGFTDEVTYFIGEPLLLNVAQILAADWSKIGITLKIKALQADEASISREAKTMFLNDYFAIIPNAPDILMSLLLSPFNIYPSGNGTDWSLYRNAEVEKLLTNLVHSTDQAGQLQLAGQALRTTASEEPYLPLFMHSALMTVSNQYASPVFSFYNTVYSPWMLSMKLAH